MLTTIRRSFHSLKGSGRMAGAEEIGEFSWQIENLMNRVIEGQVEPESGVIDLIASAVDMLPSMRARLSGEGQEPYDKTACVELAENAEQVASGEATPSAAAAAATNPELEGLDATLIELMVKELSENLETLDDWVERTQETDVPQPVDSLLVRAVHTMKGTMRLAPIGNENDTAQIFEQYLEELAHSGDTPDDAGLKAMLACQALFHKRLDRLQGEAVDESEFETSEMSSELRRLHGLAYRDRTESSQPPTEPPARTEEPLEEPLFSSEGEEVDVGEGDEDFFGLEETDEEAAADAGADEAMAPEATEGAADEEAAEQEAAEAEAESEAEAEAEGETEVEAEAEAS